MKTQTNGNAMVTAPVERTAWPRAMRQYLLASIIVQLGWETLQLPLYTLWSTGTPKQQIFAVLHCTIGDAMIAGLSLLLALAALAHPSWPNAGALRVYVGVLVLGIAYTIYSEWLNVSVRGSWTYSSGMPTVPLIGTGLAPLLQWLLVPTVALWLATGRAPWIDEQGPDA